MRGPRLRDVLCLGDPTSAGQSLYGSGVHRNASLDARSGGRLLAAERELTAMMSVASGGPPPFLTFPHKGGRDGIVEGVSALSLSDISSPLYFSSPPPLWGRVREGGDSLALDRKRAP